MWCSWSSRTRPSPSGSRHARMRRGSDRSNAVEKSRSARARQSGAAPTSGSSHGSYASETCCVSPSGVGAKAVRRAGWRATSRHSARRSAAVSSTPSRRKARPTLYAVERGSRCCSSQSRCCSEVAGAERAPAGAAGTGYGDSCGRPGLIAAASSAKSPRRTTDGGSSQPHRCRISKRRRSALRSPRRWRSSCRRAAARARQGCAKRCQVPLVDGELPGPALPRHARVGFRRTEVRPGRPCRWR